MAQPTRSGRVPVKKVIWEQSEVLAPSANAKKAEENYVQILETRANSPTAPPIIHELADEPNAPFTPPIQVDNECFIPQSTEQSPMNLFIQFLGGLQSLMMICEATNLRANASAARASSQPYRRPWSPLSPTELLKWLGGLIYMANHIERNRQDYWGVLLSENTHGLGRHISKNRWEQIHRHLTFNASLTNQKTPWWSPIEPIASQVRDACKSTVKLSKWVAVDEAMIAFTGRSKHVVNLPSKPIPKGYKVWVLAGKHGYIWSWRWHSKVTGPESTNKRRWFEQMPDMPKTQLAVTYQVPQDLCQELQDKWPQPKYVVFLDNLFLTVELAHTLLKIGFGVMGTTRKNRENFPERFLTAKQSNKQFTYGSCSTELLNHALCFLWQDNALVIGITTAFSMNEGPEDYVVKTRKRPLNNAVGAAVFGSESTKQLPIPKAIDAYNCNHNLVDLADQMRSNFTCQRQWEQRNWRPLAYWLFDTCLTNSYLIWRYWQPPDALSSRHSHHNFRNELINQLFTYKEPSPTPPISPARTRFTSKHYPIRMPTRKYCVFSTQNGGNCVGGGAVAVASRRSILGEITGNAPRQASRIPSKKVGTGCSFCKVHLCIKKGCFTEFHAILHSN